MERRHARGHFLAPRRGEIRLDQFRHRAIERVGGYEPRPPQRHHPVVLRPSFGDPERRLVLLRGVVERTERDRAHALHVPDVEVLVGSDLDAGQEIRRVPPRARILNLRRVEMLHSVAARKTDIEQECVLLERRRTEDRVLVPHDALDIPDEMIARARGHVALVVDHHPIEAVVHHERIEDQRSARRHLGGCVDHLVVVREAELPLPRPCDVAVDDRPSVWRSDRQRHRIRLVAIDVHEERRSVPVCVQRVQHRKRSGHRCVGEDAIADAYASRRSRIDAPARPGGLLPTDRLSIARGHRKLLDVLREVHFRVATGRPHRHLEVDGSTGQAAHERRNGIQM